MNEQEPWEKEFDEQFIPNDGNIPTYIENGNDLKDFIRTTISSRDTYWKEKIKGLKKTLVNEVDTFTPMQVGFNAALDTLLDNLK